GCRGPGARVPSSTARSTAAGARTVARAAATARTGLARPPARRAATLARGPALALGRPGLAALAALLVDRRGRDLLGALRRAALLARAVFDVLVLTLPLGTPASRHGDILSAGCRRDCKWGT